MAKVFVAGNLLVKEDRLALEVAEILEKKMKETEFEAIESVGELEEIPDNLYIIDVAQGIEKVEKIVDLGKLEQGKKVSLHDFDLGTELLLFKKIGKVKNVVLVAIPLNYERARAVEEVESILRVSGLK